MNHGSAISAVKLEALSALKKKQDQAAEADRKDLLERLARIQQIERHTAAFVGSTIVPMVDAANEELQRKLGVRAPLRWSSAELVSENEVARFVIEILRLDGSEGWTFDLVVLDSVNFGNAQIRRRDARKDERPFQFVWRDVKADNVRQAFSWMLDQTLLKP